MVLASNVLPTPGCPMSTRAVLQPCQLGRNRSWGGTDLWFLGGQPEQLSDEPNLRSNIIATHPSNLAFPNHVHRLIALKRSPGRMEFPEALLGVDRRLMAR
jgi:hypothetical protein